MFKRLFLLLIVLAAAAAGAAFWWLEHPLKLAHDEVEVSIEPGTPVREIVRLWHEAGVDEPPELLYQWFRWSGEAKRIRAGSYLVAKGATPRSLLRKMVVGDEELESVHIIDGWTVKQMRAALAAASGLKPTTAAMTDDQLMAAIGAPGQKAEGRFFPDTYVYSRGVVALGADDAPVGEAHSHGRAQGKIGGSESGRVHAADYHGGPHSYPQQGLV